MGWPKCMEDNLDIMDERLYMKQKNELTSVYSPVIPAKEFKIELKVNVPTNCLPKEYHDKYIVCKDCGAKILFTAKKQRYFDEMKWESPKRCKECRDFRNTRFLMVSSF